MVFSNGYYKTIQKIQTRLEPQIEVTIPLEKFANITIEPLDNLTIGKNYLRLNVIAKDGYYKKLFICYAYSFDFSNVEIDPYILMDYCSSNWTQINQNKEYTCSDNDLIRGCKSLSECDEKTI